MCNHQHKTLLSSLSPAITGPTLSKQYVVTGGSVAFECTAYGDSLTTISWTKVDAAQSEGVEAQSYSDDYGSITR